MTEIQRLLQDELVGVYLHGSLAMGGFHPQRSDIDVLGVTKTSLGRDLKVQLAQMLLRYSHHPYPVEVSILNLSQLTNWKHPSHYDFHYSELWRPRYEEDLAHGTFLHVDGHEGTDPDLAAHIMVTVHRGVCLFGPPISETFPCVSRSAYLSSIMSDFHDCLLNIRKQPVYCILNLTRVYRYTVDGQVGSKQEAGQWALEHLPVELHSTMRRALRYYQGDDADVQFSDTELAQFRHKLQQLVLSK